MSRYSALAKAAGRVGWREAARAHVGAAAAYEWTVEDHLSAACLFALPRADGTVLDLCCGHGAQTFALAKTAGCVYATDPDPAAARFVAERAVQSGVRNVRVLQAPPREALPEGSLDLLVSDRWPGVRYLSGLTGLLRPEGRICVGIGNPLWPHREPGEAAVFLSRAAAAVRRHGYRAEHAFAALPDHRHVGTLLDLSDRAAVRRFLEHRWPSVPGIGLAWRGGLSRLGWALAPGFWLVACRPGAPETVMIRTLRGPGGPGARTGAAWRTPLVHANRGTLTAPVYPAGAQRPSAVLRVEAGRALVDQESRVLQLVAEHGSPELRRSVPRVLSLSRIGDRRAACQSALEGRPWTAARSPRGLCEQLAALRRWLVALYQVRVPARSVQGLRGNDPFAIYRVPGAFERQAAGCSVSRQAASDLHALRAGGLREGLVHGDLHPGNILGPPDRPSVLDWEYSAVAWLPFDWCHYVGSVLTSGRPTVRAERAVAILQRRLAPGDAWRRSIDTATEALLGDLHLDRSLAPAFLTLGVFDFIRRRYGPADLPRFSGVIRGLSRRDTG